MNTWILFFFLACSGEDKPTETESIPSEAATDDATDTESTDTESTETDSTETESASDTETDTEPAEIDADGDGYTVDEDCDDDDADINPGAAEVCNGVDDDCNAATLEDGTAWWEAAGSWEDWSKTLGAGKTASPAVMEVTEDGTLHLCPGTWYVSLKLAADVSIIGEGEGVVLDGGGSEGILIVREDGVSVTLSDLELQNGSGSGAVLGEYKTGGGLECDAEATVTATDLAIHDCEAGVGGGIYVRGCTVTLSEVTLTDNQASYYGGGLTVLGGAVTAEGLTVSGNTAANGGGLAVVSFDGDAEMKLTDSLVRDNIADRQGGGAVLEEATLSCVGSTSDTYGILANTAGVDGGGVYVAYGSSLSSQDCDWGEGSDDNTPEDVSVSEDSWGDDETFECDTEGCVE